MNGSIPDGVFLARPERPAEGIPLAVKDLFDTAGLVTTYGSIMFADHVPEETAEAVRRLEAAGYTNVGKTNLHEFAYGTTSENPHFGTVPNPVFPGRVAGGSSGGNAAALALGLADAAVGTDSGGSVRIPATCCEIVGFKPSYGLVSLQGCFPLAPSFDHVGPMARSVAGCAEMMKALAPGFEPTEPVALGDLRVGVAWLDRCEDAGIAKRVSELADGEAVELPLAEDSGPAFMREVADVHSGLFPEHADSYGEDLRIKLERCFAVTDAEHVRSLRARGELRERFAETMEDFDLLLTPTLPVPPPPVRSGTGDLQVREALVRFTFPVNAVGAPALALPCGRTAEGLPASVQLIGRPGEDALVLAAGEALQADRSAAS